MRHKSIIRELCYSLSSKGLGINEALAELDLTTNYIAKRCRRVDRARLHQAHDCYVEGLNREVIHRARTGRNTSRLKDVIDNLPHFALPGDDLDEEREHREWRRRNFSDDAEEVIEHNGVFKNITETISQLILDQGSAVDEDDDDAPPVKPTEDPQPRRPRKHLPPVPAPKPALEASPAPLGSPQGRLTPFAALSSPDPEDANLQPPESKLHWYRLFTGRAVLRDENNTAVRSLLPGEVEYPSEFVNWN